MGDAAREVTVRLGNGWGDRGGDRAYVVSVGAGVLSTLGGRVRGLFPGARRMMLVADEGLPPLTIDMARDALRSAGGRVELATIRAEEEQKSLHTVERLLVHMAAARLERGEPVVALGGGIVGDTAGFAASIYKRGVPVIQCPTTLLAMVDASVGGKTGVNLGVPVGGEVVLRKNMVGTFHQPSLVVCDVRTLDSLADDELASGLAECIKHALIGADWSDEGLMGWTRANAGRFVARDHAALAELVARNVRIKASVVEGDEREERTDSRGRMSLNMGHTVGHAIETTDVHAVVRGVVREAPGLKHGEAVGLGLVAEAALGEALGAARPGLSGELAAVLESVGLPTCAADLPPLPVLRSAMLDDKKVGGGKLRFAVPTGQIPGCAIVTDPDLASLQAAVAAILPVA